MKTPEEIELQKKYDRAYAAVMHGVAWDGDDYESISGLTKDATLDIAGEFFKFAGKDYRVDL